jgi:hypothetical protein
MPWAQLILLVLGLLQDFPQLVSIFQEMQNTGNTTPTDQQWQELTDAINARTNADLRWDQLKLAHAHAQARKVAKG